MTDSALASLLEDDRLAKRIDEIDHEIKEEVDYVFGVSQFVWDEVGPLVGLTGPELLHRSCCSALVQASFVCHRMQPARDLPWSLCRGSVDDNLDRLKAGEKPQDDVAAKIWTLEQMGYPRAVTKQGVELLGNVSWSSGRRPLRHG